MRLKIFLYPYDESSFYMPNVLNISYVYVHILYNYYFLLYFFFLICITGVAFAFTFYVCLGTVICSFIILCS